MSSHLVPTPADEEMTWGMKEEAVRPFVTSPLKLHMIALNSIGYKQITKLKPGQGVFLGAVTIEHLFWNFMGQSGGLLFSKATLSRPY